MPCVQKKTQFNQGRGTFVEQVLHGLVVRQPHGQHGCRERKEKRRVCEYIGSCGVLYVSPYPALGSFLVRWCPPPSCWGWGCCSSATILGWLRRLLFEPSVTPHTTTTLILNPASTTTTTNNKHHDVSGPLTRDLNQHTTTTTPHKNNNNTPQTSRPPPSPSPVPPTHSPCTVVFV